MIEGERGRGCPRIKTRVPCVCHDPDRNSVESYRESLEDDDDDDEDDDDEDDDDRKTEL